MLDRASGLIYLYSIGEMDQSYLEESYKKMQKKLNFEILKAPSIWNQWLYL